MTAALPQAQTLAQSGRFAEMLAACQPVLDDSKTPLGHHPPSRCSGCACFGAWVGYLQNFAL